MQSLQEPTSPERNNLALQKSPSHSSTELQSQQTNCENSDKVSRDDSNQGSDGNDECLGYKKTYSIKEQEKESKEEKDVNKCKTMNDKSNTPVTKMYRNDGVNFVCYNNSSCMNSGSNRKMSSPVCSYYSGSHSKYFSEMADKNLIDYSKSNNYIDKETLMHSNNNTSSNNKNNIHHPHSPNIPFVYNNMPDSFMPVYQYNTIHQKSSVNLYHQHLALDDNGHHNDKGKNEINGNANSNNPETTGSKTPLGTTAQPQINTKFGFPFAIGTPTPKLQHNNFSLNSQYMPFPVLLHKGMSTMTPVYGHSSSIVPNVNNDKKPFPQFQLNTSISGIERKKHKPFMERPGDWVCAKCKNLNFAFRLTCNRCNLQKTESEKIGDVQTTPPKKNTSSTNITETHKTNESS